MVDQSNFAELTDLVIQNLEGGYFHPDMMKDGRLHYDSDLASSGETMYGLDRVNGASLASSSSWKPFWSIIDNSGARKKWKWNYNGGSYAPQLRQLAIKIMYPWFNYLFEKHLTPSAQKAVASNPQLILHFSYAAWNGEKWFKTFANPINNAVSQGITDPVKLSALALSSRTGSSSSLIRQSGAKIKKMFSKITDRIAGGGAGAGIILLLAGLFFLTSKEGKRIFKLGQ